MDRRPAQTTDQATDNLARLHDWYATPLGQALEQAELAAVREALATLFGYHLMLVAPPWQGSPLEACRIPHRLVMPSRWRADAGLVGQPQRLPVIGDSLDAIILPHILEFVPQPHEVLREVDRCLIPEGHVLILAFNPYGLWGLRRLLQDRCRRMPFMGRFIGQTRLRDWLALLGFDTLDCRPLLFRPPVQRLAATPRLAFLERLAQRGWPVPAAGYQLLARKRVVGLTPLRPRWRPRRGLVAGGLIEPSQRSGPGGGV
ncbi:MAG: class I SAM-dependent methyltransferase [Gammaproteobacteria bacterium]